MGIYLNPGTIEFQESINSEIYVDKTMIIERTNAALRTKQKYMCISRPRRFGKSMAVDMLAAYYGKDYDSAALFDGLEISHCETFSTHLNKYNVFKINMQEFLSITQNVDEMLKVLQKRLIKELKYNYPEYVDCDNLVFAMQDIFSYTGQSFIVLIDEWDCLFREYKQEEEAQRKYLDFLRVWLKDKAYIALAYMTGILPVKKSDLLSSYTISFPEISVLPTVDVRSFEIPDFNINQIFATIYSSNFFPSNRIISSSSAASYKALCTSVYLQLPDSNCIIGSTP